MNTKQKRLKQIQKELLDLDDQFFAIADGYRTTRLADPIRENIKRLDEEARELTQPPPLPCLFRYGHPNFARPSPIDWNKPEVMYGVHILPHEHTPIKAWGKIIPFDDHLKETLAQYGMEFCGEFLVPIGKPNLVRYAGRRQFVVAEDGHMAEFIQWYRQTTNTKQEKVK